MNLADRAETFLGKGIMEVSGPSSHPQILTWIQRTEKMYPSDTPIDDSQYAWCGVFVGNMVLDDIAAGNKLRLKPPGYFQGAARWKKWGVAVPFNETKRGDVVILTRKGGHHVAILSSPMTGGLNVVGGNQSNKVSIAPYLWHSVVDVRRG